MPPRVAALSILSEARCGVGKSSLAQRLLAIDGIPWLPTDVLPTVLRLVLPELDAIDQDPVDASALGRVHIAPSPSPSAENRAGRGTNLRHVSGANVEVRPSIAAAQPGRQSSWLPQFGLYSSREHVTELRQPDRRVDD